MRTNIRLIHQVQVANFWRKFLICMAIGFAVTVFIPSQSNSYPIKDHQAGLSSQLTDYAGSIAGNVEVDLSNSDCARAFFQTLSQFMEPTSIQAQWSSGGNLYYFNWSAQASKPSNGSLALKTSLRSSALDRASSSTKNTIELAQTNLTNQIHPRLSGAVRNSGATLGNYRVMGMRNGIPCCGSSTRDEVSYGGC